MNAMTREQVRAFDKHTIEQLGIPASVLMENAGRGAAEILLSLGVHGPVVICCGKGNNGGDGMVIARHLANVGCSVDILLFADPASLAGDSLIQWNIAQAMNLSHRVLADVSGLASRLARVDWVVDALFGTGLAGAVRSPINRVIETVNASPARVFAVDIPSGLDCDTGLPLGATIRAAHTATFLAPKIGFTNPASVAYTGRVHVVGIGTA